jgi:hypothetical protein
MNNTFMAFSSVSVDYSKIAQPLPGGLLRSFVGIRGDSPIASAERVGFDPAFPYGKHALQAGAGVAVKTARTWLSSSRRAEPASDSARLTRESAADQRQGSQPTVANLQLPFGLLAMISFLSSGRVLVFKTPPSTCSELPERAIINQMQVVILRGL